MHDTRKYILDILHEVGQATVDEIVEHLQKKYESSITAVTVRHHLNILQQQKLIEKPELRHRSTPGRPQHTYMLSQKAIDTLPNNYRVLMNTLLGQLKESLPPKEVNVILEGVADKMASQASLPNVSLTQRLDAVVLYLNEHGYNAEWENAEDGYILHTRNCPYRGLENENHELCNMDFKFISALMGVVPRRLGHMSEGEHACSYWIPA